MIVVCGHQRIKMAKKINLPKEQIPYNVVNFENRQEIIDFAINDNILRRQVNNFQKALLGLKLLPYYEKEAKERQKSGTSVKDLTKGRSLEKIAERVGVSYLTIHKARCILQDGTKEEVQQAIQGEISTSALYNIITRRRILEEIISGIEDPHELLSKAYGLEFKMVKYSDLEFNPRNPNMMTDEQYKQLEKSLRTFGYIQPILTVEKNGKYFVIDGEKRARKLHEMGKDKKGLPVIVCKNVSRLGAMAGAITFNKAKGKINQEKLKKIIEKLIQEFGKEEVEKYIPDK